MILHIVLWCILISGYNVGAPDKFSKSGVGMKLLRLWFMISPLFYFYSYQNSDFSYDLNNLIIHTKL